MASTLYVVSTPIGNLTDITLRALEVLRGVDLIACEDTRTTGKLLSRYEIKKSLTSYHEHNEAEKTSELIDLLSTGKDVALVSDAGTPGVSDPGYRIVKAASAKGFDVIPVPGASAALAALSVSGLTPSGFTFLGFPPRTDKKRREFIERVKHYPETLIFYESPKRLLKTLAAIEVVLGDRDISVAREITKIYEEHLRGTVKEVITKLSEREVIKGEVVIVVSGASSDIAQPDPAAIENLLKDLNAEGMSLKDAVREVTSNTGISKSKIYKSALQIWKA